MEIPKKKRIVDRKLLDKYKWKKCAVCGSTPSQPHHIKTVGSGGDDHVSNLVPLCVSHHIMVHQMGVNRMCQQYPVLDFEIRRIKTLK